MNALIVGAGNIGLGFLGQLLYRSGLFSITFLESRKDRVDLLNRERAYTVVTVSDTGLTEELIHPVRAVFSEDSDSVIDAIVETDFLLTAVGKPNLVRIAPLLARGLAERLRRRPRTEMHMIVIACENVYDNTRYLQNLVFEELPAEYRFAINDLVSFPCCMVDRIVPTTPKEIADRYALAVAVEDYFQFVVDGTALRAPFPQLGGIEISTDLPARLEQKLFTLNMLHGIVGYWGHRAGYEFVHEAMNDTRIQQLACGALDEVGQTIAKRHPVIGLDKQRRYGEKIIQRFKNRNLRDAITRVTLQPIRKLGGDERLVRPAKLTLEDGRIPAHLATGIGAALHYQEEKDRESVELGTMLGEKGIDTTLNRVMGLQNGHPLAQLIRADYLFGSLSQ